MAGVPVRSSGRQLLGSVAVAALLMCVSYVKASGSTKRSTGIKASRSARFALKFGGHVSTDLPAAAYAQAPMSAQAKPPAPTSIASPLLDLEADAAPAWRCCSVGSCCCKCCSGCDACVPRVQAVCTPVPAAHPQTVPTSAPVSAPSGWAAASPKAASAPCRESRRVGGSRRALPRARGRAARSATASAATAASTRRSVGARIQERMPCPSVSPPSFDTSRIRTKIQVGLRSSGLRVEHGRESKLLSGRVSVTSTDVLILANAFRIRRTNRQKGQQTSLDGGCLRCSSVVIAELQRDG